jgi:hypothetical protein
VTLNSDFLSGLGFWFATENLAGCGLLRYHEDGGFWISAEHKAQRCFVGQPNFQMMRLSVEGVVPPGPC